MDAINKSGHYNIGNIECISALKEWMTEEQYRGFLKGNVIKYLCREGHKDSREQDCKKAQYYLNKLVDTFNEENVKLDYDKDLETCYPDCIHFGEDDDEWCSKNCKCGVVPDTYAYNNLPYAYEQEKS